MKNAKLIFILILLTFTNVYGQDNTYAVGARAAAMGNAGAALADVWANTNNQASLALAKNFEAGVFYKNNYRLSELSLSALSVVTPTKAGNIGASVAHFGFSDYSENKISAAYSKQLWKFLAIGAQINYHSVKFSEGYQNTSTVSGEIGLLAIFSENLRVGFHVFNPTAAAMKFETKDKIPTKFKLGAAYQIAKTVLLCADLVKSSGYDIEFHGGIEFLLIENLHLRAGAATNPTLFTLGAGYAYKNFNFDIAYSRHNVLGDISCASISYKFTKK